MEQFGRWRWGSMVNMPSNGAEAGATVPVVTDKTEPER